MKYTIIYTSKAEKDLKEYKRAGADEELRKIAELTSELEEHPESGEGKVEELHYIPSEKRISSIKTAATSSSHAWSRRVSHEDRMVYTIDSPTHTVTILSLKGHYADH